jgi:hypothetical protein
MEHSAAKPALDNELIQRMIAQVATSNAKLTYMSAKVEGLEKRLFGNGQPGELFDIRSVQKTHGDWITRADEREKTNRKWAMWLAGIISSAASALITFAFHIFENRK